MLTQGYRGLDHSQAVFAVAEGLNVAPSSQFLECSGVESAIKGTGGLFVLRK